MFLTVTLTSYTVFHILRNRIIDGWTFSSGFIRSLHCFTKQLFPIASRKSFKIPDSFWNWNIRWIKI